MPLALISAVSPMLEGAEQLGQAKESNLSMKHVSTRVAGRCFFKYTADSILLGQHHREHPRCHGFICGIRRVHGEIEVVVIKFPKHLMFSPIQRPKVMLACPSSGFLGPKAA